MRNLLRELRALRADVAALRAEVAELRARPPVVINYPAKPAPMVQPWAPYVPNPYPWWPTVVCETKPLAPMGNDVVMLDALTKVQTERFTGSPLHVALGAGVDAANG